MPDEQAAQTVGPSTLQLFSLFAGFMIAPAKIPKFWRFVYWMSPVHYFLEGLVTSQFYGEDQEITVGAKFDEATMQFVEIKYSVHRYMAGRGEFSKFEGWFVWPHHWYIIVYLISLSLVLRAATTYFLAYVSYKTQ